nr:RNA-directed DNA polymerase, eukaryota [Tanacetum cinerariifolium]
MPSFHSKEDQVSRISKSVFVTNFSDSFGYRDLWKLCESYVKVVDVFISNRLSKAGKRPPKPKLPSKTPFTRPPIATGSFTNVVKEVKSPANAPESSFSIHTVVLDDSCFKPRDLSLHVMGKVKDPCSIPHLHSTLAKEGFLEVSLSYLGLWVMIELDSRNSKQKLLDHTGVNSWFDIIQEAVMDFVSEDRIVWVDLEGIPLSLWSKETFVKIGCKWGEVLDLEDNFSFSFARKRLCIRTKQVENILESFKFVFKGKVFWARAKELFTWTPSFNGCNSSSSSSDDESSLDAFNDHASPHPKVDDQEIDSVEDRVSESSFGEIPIPLNSGSYNKDSKVIENTSEDPFGLNELIQNPLKPHVEASAPSISHPLEMFDSSVPSVAPANLFQNAAHGGSILGTLEDLIRIGQSMGYDMEECSKDIERIIGGILCVWESSIFLKDNVTISDNFISLYETCLPSNTKVLFVMIYAPQPNVSKRTLWDFISDLISCWNGETIVMGDFNVVRFPIERRGSIFDQVGARDFNHFISSSGLVDIQMEGYSYTWSLSSAKKRANLIVSSFQKVFFRYSPRARLFALTVISRTIALFSLNICVLILDLLLFGPSILGLNVMVSILWWNKLGLLLTIQILTIWEQKLISAELTSIDKELDRGFVSDDLLSKRMELSRKLGNINQLDANDAAQKAKVKWAIEGDENSKKIHGLINKNRSQLLIRGIFVDGDWITDPPLVKDAFKEHFASRFKQPDPFRLKLKSPFPKRLSPEQVVNLDSGVTRSEIRKAVWGCGENKSPGPDGFSFEFFRRYWNFIGPDFCSAIECFFSSGYLPKGCNTSFIALIPKVVDAKFVNDFRPISLIGSVYKVITKILANRLAGVITDLVSDSQSTFIANRNILDGPFILNENLAWCKRKNKQAHVFKVDFSKAYDFVRWDYLLDVLVAFGFGSNWCKWIRDPLAPFLFILIMESLHISVTRAIGDGVFKGLSIQGSDPLSHLFYADDVVFLGEWSETNLVNLVKIFDCFHRASGLKINLIKSQVLGIGIPRDIVSQGASRIGCDVLRIPFKYLGVTVGDHMSRCSTWSGIIQKIKTQLSKWKSKTLFVGGRLTLLKSVLDHLDSWDKVLSSKKKGGLGVSSLFALNRGLILKWVWRFLSQDGSMWAWVIIAIYGSNISSHDDKLSSNWCSILLEIQVWKIQRWSSIMCFLSNFFARIFLQLSRIFIMFGCLMNSANV